jgi:hypothetical protein
MDIKRAMQATSVNYEPLNVLEARKCCHGCKDERESESLKKCGRCANQYCKKCVKKIKDSRASSWLVAGFDMAWYSRMSEFLCKRCMLEKDGRENKVFLLIGSLFFLGIIGFIFLNRETFGF